MQKKVGYSYWGFLGDYKFDEDKDLVSTPDGNAFYSSSIIHSLQQAGYEVIQVMPDRDMPGYDSMRDFLFSSWGTKMRSVAYRKMTHNYVKKQPNWSMSDYFDWLERFWDVSGLKDAKFVLHEYRFCIEGRNDTASFLHGEYGFQPDYVIQLALFNYCIKNGVFVYIFDLDYKLDEATLDKLKAKGLKFKVIELGNKWACRGDEALRVQIPFDWDVMLAEADIISVFSKTKSICYVGNRYERDETVYKYLDPIGNVDVYGKWLLGDVDFSGLVFHGRVHVPQMKEAYRTHMATLLMAKQEYYEHEFMTARILEAVFYGCIPFFAEEYGDNVIYKYAGMFSNLLKVRSAEELMTKTRMLEEDRELAHHVLCYLVSRLEFMSSDKFVETLEENCNAL